MIQHDKRQHETEVEEIPGAPEDIPCNCNGDFNHDACMLEIEDITLQMNGIIDDVQATSSAMVALLAYYPVIQKISLLGKDNYHPTDDGSSQLTSILQPQLGL